MIDGKERGRIEIEHLVERLGDLQSDDAAAIRLGHGNGGGPHQHALMGPRHAGRAVGQHLAGDACAEQIGDEGIALAIPGEEHRAGGRLAARLLDPHELSGGDVEFRLGHAVGPADPHHVGPRGRAQPEHDRLPRLPQRG